MKLKITRPSGEVESAELRENKNQYWKKYFKIMINGKTYYAMLGKKKSTHMYIDLATNIQGITYYDKYYVQKNFVDLVNLNEYCSNNIRNWRDSVERLPSENQEYLENVKPYRMDYCFGHDNSDNYKVSELDLNGMDTSFCTNMEGTFYAMKGLTRLDVSNWDVRSVTNMAYIFEWSDAIKSLDLSGWEVQNCTNFYRAFKGCYNLEVLDISNFYILEKAYITEMFENDNKLKYIIIPEYKENTFNNNLIYALMGIKSKEYEKSKKCKFLCSKKSIIEHKTSIKNSWRAAAEYMDDIKNYEIKRNKGQVEVKQIKEVKPSQLHRIELDKGFEGSGGNYWVRIEVPKGVNKIKVVGYGYNGSIYVRYLKVEEGMNVEFKNGGIYHSGGKNGNSWDAYYSAVKKSTISGNNVDNKNIFYFHSPTGKGIYSYIVKAYIEYGEEIDKLPIIDIDLVNNRKLSDILD